MPINVPEHKELTVDEKVLDYFDRATDIVIKKNDGCLTIEELGNSEGMNTIIIEIAKMIQLEEHKIELQEYGLNVNSKNEF